MPFESLKMLLKGFLNILVKIIDNKVKMAV